MRVRLVSRGVGVGSRGGDCAPASTGLRPAHLTRRALHPRQCGACCRCCNTSKCTARSPAGCGANGSMSAPSCFVTPRSAPTSGSALDVLTRRIDATRMKRQTARRPIGLAVGCRRSRDLARESEVGDPAGGRDQLHVVRVPRGPQDRPRCGRRRPSTIGAWTRCMWSMSGGQEVGYDGGAAADPDVLAIGSSRAVSSASAQCAQRWRSSGQATATGGSGVRPSGRFFGGRAFARRASRRFRTPLERRGGW